MKFYGVLCLIIALSMLIVPAVSLIHSGNGNVDSVLTTVEQK